MLPAKDSIGSVRPMAHSHPAHPTTNNGAASSDQPRWPLPDAENACLGHEDSDQPERRAFSLPARFAHQLQEDIEHSVRQAHAAYGCGSSLQNPSVYDKVASAAVLVYSTFSILATFLGGTQAGLLALFISDKESRAQHSVLMYVSIATSVGALLLHLAVAILATLLVLFLTLDKVVVAVSAPLSDTSASNLSNNVSTASSLFQPRLASAAKRNQPFLFLTSQLEEMEYFRHVLAEQAFPASVLSALKIISRMRGTFWELGSVLMVSTLMTLITVYLYAWTSVTVGIVATLFATFNVLLLFRTIRSLQMGKKMQEWKDKGLIGSAHPKASSV